MGFWETAAAIYGAGGVSMLRAHLRYFNRDSKSNYVSNDTASVFFGSVILGVVSSLVVWPLLLTRNSVRRLVNDNRNYQDIYNKLAGDKEALRIERERRVRELERHV